MKFVKKYQKAILGALIIGLFVGYFLLNRQDFTALHNIKPGYLLLVGLGYLVIIITNGIIMKLLAKPFGANLKTHESVRVALLGSIGNF
ncbi:hypothetical protein KDA11_06555, partial [Candidatus Saccharibacteria bacterium]|nr:hypothetical protein [Candidatus Saccharibacteria bacterium]